MFFKDIVPVDLMLAEILLFFNPPGETMRGQELLMPLDTFHFRSSSNASDALSCLINDLSDKLRASLDMEGHIDLLLLAGGFVARSVIEIVLWLRGREVNRNLSWLHTTVVLVWSIILRRVHHVPTHSDARLLPRCIALNASRKDGDVGCDTSSLALIVLHYLCG